MQKLRRHRVAKSLTAFFKALAIPTRQVVAMVGEDAVNGYAAMYRQRGWFVTRTSWGAEAYTWEGK